LFPRPPRPDFVMRRAVLEARAVQSVNVFADPGYDQNIRSLAQSGFALSNVAFRTGAVQR
jgi:hypothetical protein